MKYQNAACSAFQTRYGAVSYTHLDYRNQMKPKEARSKVIDGILASRTDCKECKPVYEKYQKIFFKKTKEKFKQEHPEVARYAKAAAYLAKHPDDKDSTQKAVSYTHLDQLCEIHCDSSRENGFGAQGQTELSGLDVRPSAGFLQWLSLIHILNNIHVLMK